MAALTADKSRSVAGNPIGAQVPVAASTTIFAGSIVSFDATGYAIPGADTAATLVAGIAAEGADNSSGADGDIDVSVQFGHVETLNHSGLVQADVGKIVVISDDNTVTDALAATNDVGAGTLLSISGSTCRVLIGVLSAGNA